MDRRNLCVTVRYYLFPEISSREETKNEQRKEKRGKIKKKTSTQTRCPTLHTTAIRNHSCCTVYAGCRCAGALYVR